jgi:hypothetical protein
MALILKRASASRPSGQWSDEDYDVLADGKVIGRILEEGSRFGPLGPPRRSEARLNFARAAMIIQVGSLRP